MHPLNFHSILIHSRVNGNSLGVATGFIVQNNGGNYLVTNWHVVSGRHPDTDEIQSSTGGVPDELVITFHRRSPAEWELRAVALFDGTNRPRWIEHPRGKSVDVVALPLEISFDSLEIHAVNLDSAMPQASLWPGQRVVTIGYPLGLSIAGYWPIWKTGHIASQPSLGFRGDSAFLIDSTTRIGMSGSPVFAYNPDFAIARHPEPLDERMPGGNRSSAPSVYGDMLHFAGTYSGRAKEQSELGIVWESGIIVELLESGISSQYVPVVE